MFDEKLKICKSKDCNNPVIYGNYCEYCKKNRKEKKGKFLAGAGSVAILGGSVAIKKGALKQIPKIAAKVLKVFSRI